MRLIVKLGLSFFFITLVILAMSGIPIKNISSMNKMFIEIDTSLLPSLIELQEMQLKFWIIRSDVLALISQTSPAEIERYTANITNTMDSIRENHDRYFEIVGESEDETHVKAKELIENIDAVSRKLNTVRKEILAFIQCEERGEAISIFEKGSCLVEPFMIGSKARYINEKQVCNSFKNFRGQNPANREAV